MTAQQSLLEKNTNLCYDISKTVMMYLGPFPCNKEIIEEYRKRRSRCYYFFQRSGDHLSDYESLKVIDMESKITTVEINYNSDLASPREVYINRTIDGKLIYQYQFALQHQYY